MKGNKNTVKKIASVAAGSALFGASQISSTSRQRGNHTFNGIQLSDGNECYQVLWEAEDVDAVGEEEREKQVEDQGRMEVTDEYEVEEDSRMDDRLDDLDEDNVFLVEHTQVEKDFVGKQTDVKCKKVVKNNVIQVLKQTFKQEEQAIIACAENIIAHDVVRDIMVKEMQKLGIISGTGVVEKTNDEQLRIEDDILSFSKEFDDPEEDICKAVKGRRYSTVAKLFKWIVDLLSPPESSTEQGNNLRAKRNVSSSPSTGAQELLTGLGVQTIAIGMLLVLCEIVVDHVLRRGF